MAAAVPHGAATGASRRLHAGLSRTFCAQPLVACGGCSVYSLGNRRGLASGVVHGTPRHQGPAADVPEERERERAVKPLPTAPESEVVDPSFMDLIACERDCRSCSYAAWLDCDGNCGVCPHNGYCPCVNPVVARSKTALKIIELRPKLLEEARARS